MSAFSSRFASILNRSDCPQPLYNSVLFETDEYVVTPTVGSILPEWLLIIPKVRELNFSRWSGINSRSPTELIGEVLRFYDLTRSSVIWFEHGAAQPFSNVACGVEHAHIHLIVNPQFSSLDFFRAAKSGINLSWQSAGYKDPYEFVSPTTSYFLASDGRESIVSSNVDKAGSQYFRRIVASLSGNVDHWDYRMFEFSENIRQTVARYGSASEKTRASTEF